MSPQAPTKAEEPDYGPSLKELLVPRLRALAGWQRALLTYNQSTAYMAKVRNHAAAYSIGRRA